jgi:hypothetical protein
MTLNTHTEKGYSMNVLRGCVSHAQPPGVNAFLLLLLGKPSIRTT